jgi:hypothetical protein
MSAADVEQTGKRKQCNRPRHHRRPRTANQSSWDQPLSALAAIGLSPVNSLRVNRLADTKEPEPVAHLAKVRL